MRAAPALSTRSVTRRFWLCSARSPRARRYGVRSIARAWPRSTLCGWRRKSPARQLRGPRDRAPTIKSMQVRLKLEYDGTGYSGWQMQRGQDSIQGRLEDALARIFGAEVRVR